MNQTDYYDQIILVDKPAGISSFGAVARVRRHLSESAGHRIKVGHCGTLDPFATGLLILVTGKNTKMAGQYSGLDKVYDATINLGSVSTTGDPEGEITTVDNVEPPTLATVQEVLRSFVGSIVQTPPVYSAIKINGRRAYQLARRGEAVQMPQRRVDIYSIDLLNYSYPTLRIRTHVSSGTYIRSLAIDIGQKLQTGAYTHALRRLQIGNYSVADAVALDDYLAS